MVLRYLSTGKPNLYCSALDYIYDLIPNHELMHAVCSCLITIILQHACSSVGALLHDLVVCDRLSGVRF